jgi:hypothetical protein
MDMIDIGKILKRAWQILWDYRVLWAFGFLLALTTTGGGNPDPRYEYTLNDGSGGPPDTNPGFMPAPWMTEVENWIEQEIIPLFATPEAVIRTTIWIAVAVVALMIVAGLLTALVRYPTETAILRMVNEYEQTGVKVDFKAGWKLGWDRRAFRVWLIDLILGIPAFLFVLLLLGTGALFAINMINGNGGAVIAGSIAMFGILVMFSAIFALFMVFLGLLRQFFIRKAALEETSVGESFQQGWAMFKRNWKSASLMWLVMLGIGIGFGIASLIAAVILIPAYIILAIPGALVAAIPGAITFGITSIFTGAPWTWIIAAIAALPFFVTIVLAPLTFLQGIYMLFNANVWTLSYCEMKTLEVLTPNEELVSGG